jgi:DNA polymerase-1
MHNGINFDIPILNEYAGANISVDKVVDTLVLSRLANPVRPGGHSLAVWGEALGFAKVEHEEWDRYSEEMRVRCESDVLLTEKVFEKLEPMLEVREQAVDIEHRTAIVISKMCRRGVTFDEQAGLTLLDELMTEKEGLETAVQTGLPHYYFAKGKPKRLKRLPNKAHWAHNQMEEGAEFQEVLYRQLSLGSRQDMVLYLKREFDWIPTVFTKTGLPAINDTVLSDLPYPETTQMAAYFRVVKLLGYLNGEKNKNGSGGGWLHHVQQGKLHANFIPLTAITGRPSCMAPNLQQVPTDPRARRLFGPRAGWSMVGVDADGQELRCLGHYLAAYDGGAYGREVVEGDIHTTVQTLIGFHGRTTTKPVEYALIYGGGDAKLGALAMKDSQVAGKPLQGKLKGKKSLKTIGKTIRTAIMEGIKGFEKLTGDVKNKASQQGRLRGLDGRTLWVRSAHSSLNLLLQSAGIIHMKQTIAIVDEMLALRGLVEDVDYGLILWVHDELQFECRPEVAELVGKTAAAAVERAAEMLGFRVKMTGGYQVGTTWSETH